MTRRNAISRLVSRAAPALLLAHSACSSAPKDDAVMAASDPTTGAELSSPEAISTRDEPPAAPVLAKPKAAPKAKRAHRPAKRVATEDEAPSAESAEMMAAQNEVAIQCAVRLPDDSSDHPELCRDFKVTIVEVGGGEVDRFRFDGAGQYRFRAKPGKTYELKPLVGKTWRVEIGPKTRFRAGEEVEARFTQKL
jgi:hypothetical protein